MITSISTITLICASVYALFMVWCLAGWLRLRTVPSSGKRSVAGTFITVIIPARNEESHIVDCLADLSKQEYDRKLFEVIVADDHSADRTVQLAGEFVSEHPEMQISILHAEATGPANHFKKQAIAAAVKQSQGELILTTDADCRRSPGWLQAFADCYETYHPRLISGPVSFVNERSILEKIQSLEFTGLIAIGAGAIRNRMPFLCNGANLGFTRRAFDEAGGYAAERNIASGDDTQLLLKIASRGSREIRFLKSKEAIVRTEASRSVGELIRQRRRWASKIPVQMNAFTLLIAVAAFFLHAGLLVQFLLLFSGAGVHQLLLPVAMKVIAEVMLLIPACRFFHKSSLLSLFLPAQIIYPFYICYVGITSLSGSYEWKGRKVN